MKKTDQWSGLALSILGLFIIYGSLRMSSYGTLHEPGAAFFPFWLGILVLGMAIRLVIQSTLERTGAQLIGDLVKEKIRWGKVISILLALVAYGYLLEVMGFLLVTFVFMVFLLRFIDRQPWTRVFIWAIVGSGGSYLVFQTWLRLRLPLGPLGV